MKAREPRRALGAAHGESRVHERRGRERAAARGSRGPAGARLLDQAAPRLHRAVQNGGRTDLVEKETAELGILENYAPPAASTAEIEQAVEAAIKETGAAGPKDMGRVMKAVMAALAGRRADGKAVNEIVRKNLPADDKLFWALLRLIILKGNAQASHPSSMGPPPKGRGLFPFTSLTNCPAAGPTVRW